MIGHLTSDQCIDEIKHISLIIKKKLLTQHFWRPNIIGKFSCQKLLIDHISMNDWSSTVFRFKVVFSLMAWLRCSSDVSVEISIFRATKISAFDITFFRYMNSYHPNIAIYLMTRIMIRLLMNSMHGNWKQKKNNSEMHIFLLSMMRLIRWLYYVLVIDIVSIFTKNSNLTSHFYQHR